MKNCLITGGTSGLGIELAKVFLLNNYFVHIIGRNKKKFEIFIKNIDVELKKKVFFYEIDLSEIKNIKNSFDKIKKLNINVLINNAGVINLNRRLNSTNLEQAFVVNYLSHYYLTNKLIENSSIVRKGVIVNISSFTHIFSNINFTNIDLKKNYNGWFTYFNTKLMNILFTYKSNNIFKEIKSIAVNPGWINTNFGNNNESKLRSLISVLRNKFSKKPNEVARKIYTIIDYDNINKNNCYYLINKKIKSSDHSNKKEFQDILWKKTKELLKNETS
jgi:short-subunit dehydrogenase